MHNGRSQKTFYVQRDCEARRTFGPKQTSLGKLRPPPRAQVVCADEEAKQIGRYETQLLRSDPNDANEHAVDGAEGPAFPASAPNQNGRCDGQDAG